MINHRQNSRHCKVIISLKLNHEVRLVLHDPIAEKLLLIGAAGEVEISSADLTSSFQDWVVFHGLNQLILTFNFVAEKFGKQDVVLFLHRI